MQLNLPQQGLSTWPAGHGGAIDTMLGQNYKVSQTVVCEVVCQTSKHVGMHQLMHELQCNRHTRPVGDVFPSQIVYQHILVVIAAMNS